MDQLVGRTLGPYELQARIGGGGMGAVYRARHVRLHQVRAIKILPPALAADRTLIERFEREARLASELRHPNILQIYDVDERDGIYFIAMELLEGRSLRDLIETEGAIPIGRALYLLRQLASALDRAHAHGVVHRDVKPANIIVSPDDHVTLVDFGIARAVSESRLTGTGTVVGTVEYMAPEVLTGRDSGPSADHYALGIVAYELLAGRAPFTGTSSQAIMYAQVHEPPPPPRTFRVDLPEDVGGVLLRQLAKEPAARYPTANAFVQELEQAAGSAEDLERAAAALQRGNLDLAAQLVAGVLARSPAAPRALAIQREIQQRRARSSSGGHPPVGRAPSPERPRSPTPVPEARPPVPGRPTDAATLLRSRPFVIFLAGGSAIGLLLILSALVVILLPSRSDATPTPASGKPTTVAVSTTASPAPAPIASPTTGASGVGVPTTASPSPAVVGQGSPTPSAGGSPPPSPAVAPAPGAITAENVTRLRAFAELRGHAGTVFDVAISRDGQTLVSSSADRTVRVWRISDGAALQEIRGHTAEIWGVAISPDGQLVASGANDQTVRLWRASNGTAVRTLSGHTNNLWSVAFSPDGQLLASASLDQTVRLWQVTDGSSVRVIDNALSYSLAFSPDSQLLAGGGFGPVYLWRLADNSPARRLTGHSSGVWVWGIAFSPDGQIIASAAGAGSGSENAVRLWRAADGSALQTLQGHTDRVHGVTFLANGQLVASGAWDKTIRFWSTADGRQVHQLESPSSVFALAASPDGRVLATAGADQVIRLWRAE